VEQMAKSFGWDGKQTADAAISRLHGEALVWMEGQVIQGRTFSNFEKDPTHDEADNSIYLALIRAYGAESNQEMALRALQSLTQKSTESVINFYSRVCVGLNDVNYMIADKTTAAYRAQLNNQILLYFTSGLQERIKKPLMNVAQPPGDADSALAGAQRIERELGLALRPQHHLPALKKPHNISAVATTDGTDISPDATPDEQQAEASSSEDLQAQIQALQQQMVHLMNKKPPQRKGGHCFFCRDPGHWADQCPVKRAQRRRRGGQGGGGGRRGAFRGGQGGRRNFGPPQRGRNFNNRGPRRGPRINALNGQGQEGSDELWHDTNQFNALESGNGGGEYQG